MNQAAGWSAPINGLFVLAIILLIGVGFAVGWVARSEQQRKTDARRAHVRRLKAEEGRPQNRNYATKGHATIRQVRIQSETGDAELD